MGKSSTKRPWRILLKKLQRKKRRQKLAQLQCMQQPEDQDESTAHSEEFEKLRQLESKEHDEQEELWLRRELIAQKEFRQQEKARHAQEMLAKELQLKQEEYLKEQENVRQRRIANAHRQFDEFLQTMNEYLDDTSSSTPDNLLQHLETNPGAKACEFYSKTNCCRFEAACNCNHKTCLLSSVLLIRNFFHHFILDSREEQRNVEAEEILDLKDSDLLKYYNEFCADVWPELESFGPILQFLTLRNKVTHLKGHVFVQYADKRSALKAFIKLQHRFYASKRIHVEFSHITNWRTAICGMSLSHNCPKGDGCYYLHVMSNPGNKYNIIINGYGKIQLLNRKGICNSNPLQSWNEMLHQESNMLERNWRWSQSPEIEVNASENPSNTLDKLLQDKNRDDKKLRYHTIKNERHVGEICKHNSKTTGHGSAEREKVQRPHKSKERSRSKEQFLSKYNAAEKVRPHNVNEKTSPHKSKTRSSLKYKDHYSSKFRAEKEKDKSKDCCSSNSNSSRKTSPYERNSSKSKDYYPSKYEAGTKASRHKSKAISRSKSKDHYSNKFRAEKEKDRSRSKTKSKDRCSSNSNTSRKWSPYGKSNDNFLSKHKAGGKTNPRNGNGKESAHKSKRRGRSKSKDPIKVIAEKERSGKTSPHKTKEKSFSKSKEHCSSKYNAGGKTSPHRTKGRSRSKSTSRDRRWPSEDHTKID